MHHEHAVAGDPQVEAFGQRGAERAAVVVAADRQHGSDPGKSRENVLIADVARMQKNGAPGERGQGFGSREPVRVRDESHDDAVGARGAGGPPHD